MRKLIIILTLGLLASCSDRTNTNDIGKEVLSIMIKNDTSKLRELFLYNMDSLLEGKKEEILSVIQEFNGKECMFIKTDTESVKVAALNEIWNYLDIYFKIDTNYYCFNTAYVRDANNNIFLNDYVRITNLSDNCADWTINVWCPNYLINFNRLKWTTDFRNKMFTSGAVEIENQTKTEIDYVKFRIVLKNNTQTFFSQTVVSTDKIFPKDITNIDIPGMNDLYTDFIIDKTNLQFEAELIEVRPKPENGDCKKIIELKAIK